MADAISHDETTRYYEYNYLFFYGYFFFAPFPCKAALSLH